MKLLGKTKDSNISKSGQWAANAIKRERASKRFWVVNCAIAWFFACVSPIVIVTLFISEMRKPQQVAVIDPAGNLFLSSNADLESEQELVYWTATMASNSLLQRGSKGLAYPNQAEQMFVKQAQATLQEDISQYRKAAVPVSMKWELELDNMEIIKDSDPNIVKVKVTGTINEHTYYANMYQRKPRKFELGLKMKKNGDILKKGRLPYLVDYYKLEFIGKSAK